MTEPNPIVDRVTATARTVFDESAKVLQAESKKVDADNYQVADAITATAKLVNVGVSGLTDLGRIVLEEKPPAKTVALGEYVVSVMQRMIGEVGTVAGAAAVQAEAKNYTPSKWLESMTRLTDIAIAGTMEIVETVVAGPARFEERPARSDFFKAPESDVEDRVLTIHHPLTREASPDEIDSSRISFAPPILVNKNVEFQVLVDPSGLSSGLYHGTVKAGPDVIPVHISL